MRNVAVILAMLLLAGSARAAFWHTDFGQAQAKAFAENRTMLVYFTTSDDCATCARMQEEVFSKFEFQTFADRHLILVEVDFPRWKPIHPTHWKINQALANKYDGHARPWIVLVNGRGEAIGRMGYRQGGPAVCIKEIERIAGITDKPGAAARPDTPSLYSGAPTRPPPNYDHLALKSISGTGSKRLALINNVTLAAGETGKVRLAGRDVRIHCEEIRDAAVIVTVEGKTGKRELRLFPPEGPPQAKAK